MHRRQVGLAFWAVLLAAPGGEAAEPNSYEPVAARLLEATVTVRILPPKHSQSAAEAAPAGAEKPAAGPAASKPAPPTDEALRGVTVCSGVCVAKGLVVTFDHPVTHPSRPSGRYRVTLSDGEQAKAAPRVVDHYSGLTLVELDKPGGAPLELAAELPAVGADVLTAAAAGIERPVVSLGIVGGVDRSIAGTGLPGMLQCDVRTTEASAGAGVVDRGGKLLGVVAATAVSDQGKGWTFAVPARHVQRLLGARQADRLVVLERQRPTIGLTMGAGAKEGTVEVERVEPGGPAERAGIRRGDVIVEAEGRKIRSAYQAIDLILSRQPGERLKLVVSQQGQSRTVDVTLGSSGEPLRLATDAEPGRYAVGPQIKVRPTGPWPFEVREPKSAEAVEKKYGRGEGGARDEVTLLRRQVDAYGQVISTLQAELRRRQELAGETERRVRLLEREVLQLRQSVGASRPTGDDKPAAPAKPGEKP